MSPITVVSAPGKVLVAGGYLVLDQNFTGVVISTSSRFYTVIRDSQKPGQIIVRSPQFIGAEWSYSVAIHDDGKINVSPVSASKNNFVYYALKYTLILASERLSSAGSVRSLQDALQHGLDIATVGDNDFYSQRSKLQELNLSPTIASLANIPPFNPQNVPLDNVNKTGLGSSAALITSIVSALLLRLGVITEQEFAQPDSAARKLAHNTAQFIHCFAQGKVGSGFDVSSAVFGSQLYTRFNPALLDGLMRDVEGVPLSPVLSPGDHWDYKAVPIQLPPLIKLVLADVAGGSNTPSLANKVLTWRKENPERANALWADIYKENQAFASAIQRIWERSREDALYYPGAVKRMSGKPAYKWLDSAGHAQLIADAFLALRKASEYARFHIRELSDAIGDGVQIEPDEQTALLEASIAQKGVICGGVPGAGGYDAIWLLVCAPDDGTSEPLNLVEKVWQNYPHVTPLLATESTERGAKVEDIDQVPGLRTIVELRR